MCLPVSGGRPQNLAEGHAQRFSSAHQPHRRLWGQRRQCAGTEQHGLGTSWMEPLAAGVPKHLHGLQEGWQRGLVRQEGHYIVCILALACLVLHQDAAAGSGALIILSAVWQRRSQRRSPTPQAFRRAGGGSFPRTGPRVGWGSWRLATHSPLSTNLRSSSSHQAAPESALGLDRCNTSLSLSQADVGRSCR